MNENKPRQWFQARLRWAVLEEGWGLSSWREAEHFFLSQDRETAFQEALRLGYKEEHSTSPTADQPGTPVIDWRFAQVVYLEELGTRPTTFEVDLGEKEANEAIGFDHEFNPAAQIPGPIF